MKVIDTHIHYGTDPHVAKNTCCPDLIRGNPDSVIKFLETQNASNGVLFPHDRVMSPPWDADYDKANMEVGEAVLKYPNEIAGVARINPTFGSKHTQNLIEKYVKEWGCRGLKLVAGYDFYRPNDMDVVRPMLDKCNEYNLTVLFHSGDFSRDLPYLQAQAAKSYPEVTFVLAHIGMHHFLWEAIIACQEYKNINVDMSQAFPFDIKTFISNVGTDRLTYGSDAPYQSTKIEQEKLRVIDLSQDDLAKVFRENARRIWNFK